MLHRPALSTHILSWKQRITGAPHARGIDCWTDTGWRIWCTYPDSIAASTHQNCNIRRIGSRENRAPAIWTDRWRNRCESLTARVYRCVFRHLSLPSEFWIAMWSQPSEILRLTPDKCIAAAAKTHPTNTNPVDRQSKRPTAHHLGNGRKKIKKMH